MYARRNLYYSSKIYDAPVIALTATATDKVRNDIKKNLGIVEGKDFKSSFNRQNLYYEVRQKTAEVEKDIIKFIKQNPNKSGIIYCLSRKKVEDLAEVLRANNIKAAAYHAGMDNKDRNETQDDFIMEKLRSPGVLTCCIPTCPISQPQQSWRESLRPSSRVQRCDCWN